MKKDILVRVIAGIILLIVGTLIGIYINEDTLKDKKAIEHLEYRTITQPPVFLTSNTGVESDIKVTYKNKEVKNLQEVLINIYNHGKSNFEDIPIYIDLKNKKNEEVNILYKSITGKDEMIEFITEIPVDTISNNNHRFGYNLTVANAESPKAVFTAKFLVESKSELEVALNTNKTGLELKEMERIFDYQLISEYKKRFHFYPGSILLNIKENFINYPIITILIIIGIILLMIIIGVWEKVSHSIKFKKRLFEKIRKSNIDFQVLNNEETVEKFDEVAVESIKNYKPIFLSKAVFKIINTVLNKS